jgi:hypothetical protein
MTDSEIALLRQDQVLVDHRGREWRVLGDARVEYGVHWAMIRCGDLVQRLTYRNATGFRLRPAPTELATLRAAPE